MKRRLVTGLAALGAVSMATPAHAALHTWSLIPYIADPLEHALGGGVDLDHLVTFTLVAALLMLISVRLGAKYRKMLETGDISPSPKFSLMNVVETIAAAVKGLLTEVVGLHYLVSAAIGFMLGLVSVYLLSIHWVFTTRRVQKSHHEALIFAIIGFGGLGINELGLYLLTEALMLHYAVSKLLVTGLVFGWNFGIRKILLFR